MVMGGWIVAFHTKPRAGAKRLTPSLWTVSEREGLVNKTDRHWEEAECFSLTLMIPRLRDLPVFPLIGNWGSRAQHRP